MNQPVKLFLLASICVAVGLAVLPEAEAGDGGDSAALDCKTVWDDGSVLQQSTAPRVLTQGAFVTRPKHSQDLGRAGLDENDEARTSSPLPAAEEQSEPDVEAVDSEATEEVHTDEHEDEDEHEHEDEDAGDIENVDADAVADKDPDADADTGDSELDTSRKASGNSSAGDSQSVGAHAHAGQDANASTGDSEPNVSRNATSKSSESGANNGLKPHATPATPSRQCLCVFDLDRTLTGEQENIVGGCPRNKMVHDVEDDAYHGGDLTLSALAASGISSTFCGQCYLGLCSHGHASGAGSSERNYLLEHVMSTKKQVAFQKQHSDATIWSESTDVRSPLVVNTPKDGEPVCVERIRMWYWGKGVYLPRSSVYFFGDRRTDIQQFAGTGLNAREVSCTARDRELHGGVGIVGLCGAAPEEIVDVKGVHTCDGGRPGEKCHTAVDHEECSDHVYWAMHSGIYAHPDWYPGLTPSSSFEDFQAVLHGSKQHHDVCTAPCFPVCHTALLGEECYRHVRWAMDVGITQHPEWYPGIAKTSTMKDVQDFLHAQNLHHCSKPC